MLANCKSSLLVQNLQVAQVTAPDTRHVADNIGDVIEKTKIESLDFNRRQYTDLFLD